MKQKKSKILRDLLQTNNFLPVPSCFDALSAKLIEQVGFKLMFMSGFAASASRIGQPDLGVMTLTEVLDQLNNITDASTIPLIGDGDTGYGNAMNVIRTVKSFAKIDCAGVLIEDQLSPKRCHPGALSTNAISASCSSRNAGMISSRMACSVEPP